MIMLFRLSQLNHITRGSSSQKATYNPRSILGFTEGSGFVILGPNQDQGGPLLLKSKFGWKKLLMEEDWLLRKIWRVVNCTRRNQL